MYSLTVRGMGGAIHCGGEVTAAGGCGGCSYCNGSPSLVTYVAARPCVLKGPQPLETVPSAGDQIFKHMSLWGMFHAETTVDSQAPDTSNIRKPLSSPNWGWGGGQLEDAAVTSRANTLD